MRISLEQAASLLKNDQVIAVPTETVYGLAASSFSCAGVEEIYRLKRRPSSNPLILHVSKSEEIYSFVSGVPKGFNELAEAFWPGPLTIVLEVQIEKIPKSVRAGLTTAAFRIPLHPLTRQLLEITGPLVMPSANISGSPSSTTAEHVERDFGLQFPVLDGGGCQVGLESTILINLQDRWYMIRHGALPAESFEAVLGYQPTFKGNENRDAPICPGQLFRHYAPNAKLILSRECSKVEHEVIVGFIDRVYASSNRVISLGALSHPESIAENLYKILRFLDEEGIDRALVDIDFSEEGVLKTVMERLTKAAGS